MTLHPNKHGNSIVSSSIITSRIITSGIIMLSFIFCLYSCSSKNETNHNSSNHSTSNNIPKSNSTANTKDTIIQYSFEIVDTLNHETSSYTQGLIVHNNNLFESTGLEGHSKLLKKNLKNGKIETAVSLAQHHFGEGITILNDKIYQLTWLNQICLVYDLKTMKKINEFSYMGEGWGLTNNDSMLLMSNGSGTIKIINPENFITTANIKIKKNNIPVNYLNELELVDSLLYANVYTKDLIIIANINTGKVVGEINITTLRKYIKNKEAEVANGIAYDKKTGFFYLTGKNWDKIFVVKLLQK